ncbi:hypothetical protein CLHUN_29330 [Ruminiclostridium hungatei]|uniref:Uncharacterized protein n=1 Tax=Ruminiclostridium hungatei TaxID=48256 RepID=A0A1V4SHF8_RUMHU|nr:hypothetical protein [Ruminiclostridium hungatei]OPX43183.1 hypothetical protein CLHUN_29330 [Ruminiclostridium hungatei]
MDYMDIDRLKNLFSDMLRNQSTLRSMDLGIEGKLIAIGYKPYWTNRQDSKIETLELNFIDKRGVMVPIILKNVVDYELYPKEGKKSKKYRANMIEIILLSPYMLSRNSKDVYDKIKLEIIYDD